MTGSIALDAGRQVWLGRASRTWQQATATVEWSELVVRTGKATTHIPHVVYRYDAAGRRFRSSMIEATRRYSAIGAKRIVAQYRPGMAVPVFHDGEGRSVLRQGVRAPSWIALVVAGGACLGLLAMLVRLLVFMTAARSPRQAG